MSLYVPKIYKKYSLKARNMRQICEKRNSKSYYSFNLTTHTDHISRLLNSTYTALLALVFHSTIFNHLLIHRLLIYQITPHNGITVEDLMTQYKRIADELLQPFLKIWRASSKNITGISKKPSKPENWIHSSWLPKLSQARKHPPIRRRKRTTPITV